MAKYSEKTQEHVEDTMHRMKKGKLKSGRGGKGGTVKNRKQAVAIALSEAREKGFKAPAVPKKKTASKKSASKSAGTKRAAKKASSKSAAKKKTARKTTSRSSASKTARKRSKGVKKASSRSKAAKKK